MSEADEFAAKANGAVLEVEQEVGAATALAYERGIKSVRRVAITSLITVFILTLLTAYVIFDGIADDKVRKELRKERDIQIAELREAVNKELVSRGEEPIKEIKVPASVDANTTKVAEAAAIIVLGNIKVPADGADGTDGATVTGPAGPPGKNAENPLPPAPGKDGADGISITAATIRADDCHLIFTFSDASQIDAGPVCGPKGDKGDKGDPGASVKGDKGDTGDKGEPGGACPTGTLAETKNLLTVVDPTQPAIGDNLVAVTAVICVTVPA